MSLFLKIFLWFWLAIALVVAALTFVNWSTQSEPLVRQWQTFVGEVVSSNAATAAQIYQNEGQAGLQEYLTRVGSAERVNAVGLYDENRQRIAGSELAVEAADLFKLALQSDNPEFIRLPDQTIAAKRLRLKDGVNYVYIIQLKRPPHTPFLAELRNRTLQILTVIFTAGLVCFALARYLTSPIGKLRRATQKLAGGDLQTRVASKIGKRHDEVAKLAEDFDEMAERIENLLMSQKRLTQDISHELRSPLARMNVALELVRTKANAEAKPLLERIETESNRLNEMISRLLMLSKLESGTPDFDKQTVNLSRLVEQIASDADFEARANSKAVKVLHKDEIKVVGNENLLRSAIENVLRNAVRYTKDETTVEVSLRQNGKYAIVTVKDYGAGVPDAELANLFRPFYRVGEARERKTGGIGLGLAIAERAVHAHKGIIKAENAEQGLVVEIKLPDSAAHQ
jgi:two-component system sensor histidine kinase CpxA